MHSKCPLTTPPPYFRHTHSTSNHHPSSLYGGSLSASPCLLWRSDQHSYISLQVFWVFGGSSLANERMRPNTWVDVKVKLLRFLDHFPQSWIYGWLSRHHITLMLRCVLQQTRYKSDKSGGDTASKGLEEAARFTGYNFTSRGQSHSSP